MIYDLPLPPQTAVEVCMQQAAIDYQIPYWVLPAIRHVEKGKSGQASKNSDGTFDYGPMQINTVWVQKFQNSYGISPEDIRHNDCINIRAAAYIVRYEINLSGDLWHGIGRYHSRTPSRKQNYAWQVYWTALKLFKELR